MKIWMKWLIIGILSILFGIFVLANPVAASVAVTTVAGVLFLVSGGFQIFAGFGEESTGAKLMGIGLGILMVFLGLSLTIHPLEGIISLVTLITILFAANGIMRLVSAFQMRDTPFFWPMLLSGALTVLLAAYIVANFFEIAPGLLGLLLGIELVFNGVGLLMLAFFLKIGKGAIKDKIEEELNK